MTTTTKNFKIILSILRCIIGSIGSRNQKETATFEEGKIPFPN